MFTNKNVKRANMALIKSNPAKQKGAAAIEYAVIAALIVVALWAAVETIDLEEALSGIFTAIETALDAGE